MGRSTTSKKPRINIYNDEYYQRIVPSTREYSRKNYHWEDELEEYEEDDDGSED